MTFNELRDRYERATSAERQRVLDLIPGNPLTDNREVWGRAMREVFEAGITERIIVGDDFETSELNLARRSPSLLFEPQGAHNLDLFSHEFALSEGYIDR